MPSRSNRLIASLPASERRNFLAGCETIELKLADTLYVPGEHLDRVYFPTEGYIALTTPIVASASIEVGLIGDEGMFGTPIALGVDASTLRAVVQGLGSALRMDATRFRRELERCPVLQRGVRRYAAVQLAHLAQTAACTRFHVVEARLARRLLMVQDRAHARTFRVTQNLLGDALGVRRVGVTRAAISLQKRDLIDYRRGNITIIDRRGLKAAACGCYMADRESYERILVRSASPATKRRSTR